MDAPLPNYGWPTVLVAVLTLVGTAIAAIMASKKRRREKLHEADQDRQASAAAGDLDLEHLDRERIDRVQE
jgi:regulator of protease activity HflC (stomatin/prohibitin superfamily)